MQFLILAVCASAATSLVLRLAGSKVKSQMAMFSLNYLFCIVLAFFYTGTGNLLTVSAELPGTILMGLINGGLYLTNFVLYGWNIRKNGMVLSATFVKLGIIIPTLMAILVFGEKARVSQIVGFGLAIAAIILINFEKTVTKTDISDTVEATAPKFGTGWYRIMLLVLLCCGGITDSMANVYNKTMSGELSNHFLFITFFAAMIIAGLLWLRDIKKGAGAFSLWDVLFGILLGIPNYYSARFLLWSLNSIPAVIVYPVYSVGTILSVTVISRFLFKEKISRQKKIALGIIFLALVLLNI